ncbi:MAG: hypothetical protein KBS59_06530, partial [Clostridiales bacterium]|nr:hypothetical protein [Clostridiales bacterium]
SNITSFMQSSLYTDNYIYIIDPELYESYKDSGVFVPLSDYCGNIPEEMLNDELSIKLGKTAFYSKAGISSLPSDMLIVLKTVPYFSSSRKTAAATEMQSVHAEIIRNIVNLGLCE